MKIPLIILILILIAAIAIVIFRNRTVPVTNTGAVIPQTTPAPNDPYVEYSKLLDMGNFTQDGFSVASVSASTSVAVFLDKPYDTSQTKFETWLKDNGFGEIPKEKIVYFHNF